MPVVGVLSSFSSTAPCRGWPRLRGQQQQGAEIGYSGGGWRHDAKTALFLPPLGLGCFSCGVRLMHELVHAACVGCLCLPVETRKSKNLQMPRCEGQTWGGRMVVTARNKIGRPGCWDRNARPTHLQPSISCSSRLRPCVRVQGAASGLASEASRQYTGPFHHGPSISVPGRASWYAPESCVPGRICSRVQGGRGALFDRPSGWGIALQSPCIMQETLVLPSPMGSPTISSNRFEHSSSKLSRIQLGRLQGVSIPSNNPYLLPQNDAFSDRSTSNSN